MSTVKRFPSTAQAQEIFQILKADGIVVIESAANTALLDATIGEIGSLTEGQNFGLMPNSSNEIGVLLTAFTSPGWCRQEENQYLAIPYEYVETLPKDVQRFLGYYVSLPYGGAVEHMEPLDFLAANGDWTKYIPVDLV
ncbi:hypothetical protein H9Q72_013101 [Fusarium xylarioides]|uniref:Uncharacterized protein n=1 Tax=Fusarium xylarioides TaxID=221167 RepID=A0A9P7HFS1_9HYPO|nr:hypothetical protein H9Q72_013101 [Fusarium xylarioides]